MNKKTKSIKQIFILAMLCTMLFQCVIFVIAIIWGGILSRVTDYSYDPLIETTNRRKTAVEEQLNGCSGMLLNYNNNIKNKLQNVSSKYNAPISQLLSDPVAKNELFAAVSDEIKGLASNDEISGSFVILDYNKDITLEPVDALYLRNINGSNTNSICLAIGSEGFIQSMNISRYSFWRNQLSFVEMDRSDFYTEPLRLGEAYKDVATENLGYWSYVYDINNSGQPCIAFSIPLRDSAGTTYGVVGIEISKAKIDALIPYLELNSKGMGSYILAGAEKENSDSFTIVSSTGERFNKINMFKENFSFDRDANAYGAYTIKPEAKIMGKLYSTKNVLDINQNAEYDKHVWILSGAVEGLYLLELIHDLKFRLIVFFGVTLILSLGFILLFTNLFTKPINRFVQAVKEITPSNLKTPDPIFVAEFNELGQSIESLTKDLSDFSAKASLIINMAGVPVGAFEYDRSSNVVFCTDMALDILKIDNEENKLFVPRDIFEQKMAVFLRNIEPNIDKIYKTNTEGENRWLHIKTALNNGRILGTIRDVTAETLAEQERIHNLEHDNLTGLINRDIFYERVHTKISARRMGVFGLMVINLDGVSAINKEYGTITGDYYIKAAGETLGKFKNPTTLVTRSAGDEFNVFMGCRTVEHVRELAQTIFEEVSRCGVESRGEDIMIKMSVGVSVYPGDTTDIDTLLRYAEFAMNTVKSSGKNNIAFFKAEDYNTYIAGMETKKDISKMIENMDIAYAYQPIVDTTTGDIYGYEALMRPNGHFSPEVILNYAAENNLNYLIEKTTWFNSLEGYTSQVDCLSPRKIFINSIPSQLLTSEDIEFIESRYGSYLDNIVLEVVESEQIDKNVLSVKRDLTQRWNCMVAIDDYGSGYSNDNTLISVKPNLIKLDMELVTGIEEDSDRQSLVKNIVSYAHNRNIKVLAEGIETKEQMYTLLSIGVDLLQGFYLARPDVIVAENIDLRVKDEILNYDPNDMFKANVGLTL